MVAPTVLAPVVVVDPADAITTRQRIIPKRRALSTRLGELGQNVSHRRAQRWIALLVIVGLVALSAGLFWLWQSPEPESTGVEIRHPAANGSHAAAPRTQPRP